MGAQRGPTLTSPVPPSQIKVRDLSRLAVAIQPAEYSSWAEARSDLMVEAKRTHKARLASEVQSAANDEEIALVRKKFDAEEKDIEHFIDHSPREMHCSLDVSYNFLSK